MAIADEMRQTQSVALTEMIGKRNSLVEKINAATGNREALKESVENSDDEDIASLRVKIAELQDQFDAIVSERMEKVLADSTDNAEGLKTEVVELDKVVKAGVNFYKQLYGKDAVEADLPKVVRLRGASAGGTGGRRIRGYNVVVTIGDTTEEFENFASAAKYLGADTSDLQEQFFAKAGVEKIKDAPDEVKFGVSWKDTDEEGNETEHTATVKAYRTETVDADELSDDEDEVTDGDVPDEDDLESV